MPSDPAPAPRGEGDGTPRVGVVTDSTAYLPGDLVRAAGVAVVPLEVVLGGVPHPEPDVSGVELVEALRRRTPVTTSRPAPTALLAAYRRLAEAGAQEVVSVHLSGQMSGTCAGARLAARNAPVPVHVVDSRSLAMGLGLTVLAAVRAAATGLDGEAVAGVAREHADRVRMWFYVETLEHLRRGGRIGAAQALLGSALSVKPLLQLVDGSVEPLERVRTAGRALARLAELAAQSAGGAPVDVVVHHLANPERAAELAALVGSRLDVAGEVRVSEVGAVVGAHVGPGTVGLVVAPAA